MQSSPLVFLYHDFSVAGQFSCVFISALFLYFLQAHLYLQLIFTKFFLALVELYIKVKQGRRSALRLMPQLVSLLLATLLTLVFQRTFSLLVCILFYIIKVVIFCWHLSCYFLCTFFQNLKVCATAWLWLLWLNNNSNVGMKGMK